jgi:hypothetical protein
MKNVVAFSLLLMLLACPKARAQQSDTTFYLLTCGPGEEVYSHYGHSALLVSMNGRNTVYNWGLFDFDAPNFAWNFAKGRLDYYLGTDPLNSFLKGYFYEQRYVLSQKMNVTAPEKREMLELIAVNLRPENVKYRYDFFYDDCSTRIRDLLEKAIGKDLVYPPEKNEELPTFRDMINKYQVQYPWLQFGIDLLIGSPAEKKADLRSRMFLPDDLMSGLSASVVMRDGKKVPLLDEPVALLDFDPPAVNNSFLLSPVFVFSMCFVLIAFLTFLIRSRAGNNLVDFVIFFIFSLLALLMIFFNFFADHPQTHSNLNIIWLNPVLLICFIMVLINHGARVWFRLVLYITLLFIVTHLFLPQAFNAANYPLILIILLRSFARSEFSWNPIAFGRNS